MKKKKIVIIGGGNGSSIVINAFKQHVNKFDLKAIVSMSDSGGSSGKLRREFGCLPPGDVLRAILAMSPYDYLLLKQIFYRNRFENLGHFSNHNLGNLFLTLGTEYGKNFLQSVEALSQAVEAVGKVIPSFLQPTDLMVELSNGEIVVGEAFIDRPRYPREWRIKKAWLQPKVKMQTEAIEAIEEADYVIFSPGSLYTSVIATILPDGAKHALENSKAKFIFMAGNGYEPEGETGPIKLSDAVKELESYLPRPLDKVIFNSHKHNKKELEQYKSKGWAVLEFDKEKVKKNKLIYFDYERSSGGLCPDKIAKNIKKVL